MADDQWYKYLKEVHDAVMKYGEIEFQGLVRRVIYRLQQFPASGIYGDAYTYKTLWDEWCHEVQEGPHDLLEWAWDQTLPPFFKDVIDRVPAHTRELLSKYAQWELDLDLDSEPGLEDTLRLLMDRVSGVAASRDIWHLRPNEI